MKPPPFPAMTPTGRYREGVAILGKDIKAWEAAGGLNWGGALLMGPTTKGQRQEGDYAMADASDAFKEANEIITDAQAAYHKTIDAFRGRIKNDLVSIAASSDKIVAESSKMQRATQATVAMLVGPEMEKALQNAERLATALKAISELQSHSLTFAVLDRKPTP